ncbi:MAG: hypothetical protein IJQ14_06470 [Bacteroidales bacterium]|nr:hypothetical protein [Bacteroidales bacterium]
MARNQGRNANIVYGICTNTSGKEDGTPCSKCQSKEKQAIRASKDFVCEECGEPLKKIEVKDGNKKLPIIIAAAVVVIGGGLGAFLGLSGGKDEKPVVVDTVTIDNPQPEVTEPEVTEPEPVVKPEPEKAQTPKPASGFSLGWGSYSGPMQGGKPHGVGGTIKVKQSYSIDLKDGRGTMLEVNPGETIENTKFENGRLRAGELHRADNSRKWFNC